MSEAAVVGQNMGYDLTLANDATACFDPRLRRRGFVRQNLIEAVQPVGINNL